VKVGGGRERGVAEEVRGEREPGTLHMDVLHIAGLPRTIGGGRGGRGGYVLVTGVRGGDG